MEIIARRVKVKLKKVIPMPNAESLLTQWQKSERYNGRMGFGGSTPCAQTKGSQVFIDKHPETYLREGDFHPKPAFFGSNKHEGSFVLGGDQVLQ